MRTLQALERLAFQPLSVSELAAAMQIHPRTARRLMRRLEVDGYITTPESRYRRRYHLTHRLAALGRQALAHTDWPRHAAPWVATLAARTQRPASLWAPCYADVVWLLRADPGGPFPEPILGALAPAHASAPGKALLAHRPAWRQSLLAGPLQRHTSRTVTDPHELQAELDHVRDLGHATDHGEHDADVHAIAIAVILDDDAIAAISIDVAAAEQHTADPTPLVAHATRTAATLTDALSNRPADRPPK
jgi:DNA-binding IclR family transcriptional regulator